MAARQSTYKSLNSIAGAILLALGLVILFANLDGVADSVSNFAGSSAHEALGVLPALGIAALHAAQSYAFDHAGFSSSLLQILVSFWPLVLIFASAIVLRRALVADQRRSGTAKALLQLETSDVRSSR